jgi:hypothetical protein
MCASEFAYIRFGLVRAYVEDRLPLDRLYSENIVNCWLDTRKILRFQGIDDNRQVLQDDLSPKELRALSQSLTQPAPCRLPH